MRTTELPKHAQAQHLRRTATKAERMLVVEVDGATHSTIAEKAKDAARERFLKAEGYRVIRVQNADIYENLDGVCEFILAAVEGRDTL
jgi:very-short-patch-repair endonuclease